MSCRLVIFKKLFLMSVAVVFLIHSGCRESEIKLEEKKAQSQLVSKNWQNRNQGLFALEKLRERGVRLNKKTAELLVNSLKEVVQMKESFVKKGKTEGKNINQIEEEFEKLYPHQSYTAYLEDLVVSIVDLRVKEGIPIIFSFILDGGYLSSGAILTNFGDPAFDFLIDKVSLGNDGERELAMAMLSVWINPPTDSDHIDAESIPSLTEKQKQRLKPILVKAFENSDLELKYWSIRGLGAFQQDVDIKNKLMSSALHGETEEIRSQTKRILKNSKF